MKFLSCRIKGFALSAVIFAWNAVHVKRTVRKERYSLMLEMDADVLLESFKVRLMEQLQHAAARMKMHAVISVIKYKERRRENTR
jgi:hypothetical protein